MRTVTVTLTLKEAKALRYAAISGTNDDTINHIGFDASEKSAYRRADRKLSKAINDAS